MQAWFRRYGAWVGGAKGSWIMLAVWVVVTGALSAMWPGVNSMENNGAPNLKASMPSVQADRVVAEQFPGDQGIPALLVWHRQGGLNEQDWQALQTVAADLSGRPLPDQTGVPPVFNLPPQALRAQASPDGSTFLLPVLFSPEADADRLKISMEQLKERMQATLGRDPFDAPLDGSELNVRITGPAGIQVDATALFKQADVTLLLATVLLVLVLLLVIYRSPILALIPLIGVGFAYGITSPILGFMAKQGWVTYDSQSISIMTVLLFGAGTDYCLFLVAQYRQKLGEHADKRHAIRAAIGHSSGAIAMSGFTVVLSLLALLVATYGAYHRFAVPFSLSILVMGIASLTLVPALLAILGRVSFFPFIPRTPEMQAERARKRNRPVKANKSGRFGAKIGGLVTRHPVWIVVISVVLLGALALNSSRIPYTYDLLSSFPEDMPSREGYQVISDSFSPGELAPLKVMVETDGKTLKLAEALRAEPYVSKVSDPVPGKTNPNLVALDVELNLNPYSTEAMHHIPDVRGVVEREAAAAGLDKPADRVWIAGQTAAQYDTLQATNRDTFTIIPIVIGLIAILLVAYLRSVTAMLYLILTVILSFFSALGLGWFVLHELMGIDAIQGSIPLYAFVFLVALGEDYNIFMISSIWQKRKTMPLKQAIAEGVSQTGSVITSAGLILAGTFAVLATLPIQVLLQFGLITAIGVLLDTFIVRPFLVPAITALLGRRAFWPGRTEPDSEPAVER